MKGKNIDDKILTIIINKSIILFEITFNLNFNNKKLEILLLIINNFSYIIAYNVKYISKLK